jgi:predicted  nucleic acid-binding Zn-ribbon protein
MKASPQAQAVLLDIQVVDNRIAQLQARKRELPEHAEVAQGKEEWAQLKADTIANNTLVTDTAAELSKAEADLVPVRERIERDQKRVDDGLLDAKALTAMLAEIEHLKERVTTLEDVQLEVMERMEAATAEKDRLAAKRVELEAALRDAMARRDALVAGIDSELADADADRADLAKGEPADLLALYDRIRARANGVGVGKLEGRRCSGCHLDQTAEALNRYSAAPADEVVRCEECDRILVR